MSNRIDRILEKVEQEPDYSSWEEGEYDAHIVRNEHSGHLCGYVSVPDDHPLHGVTYNDHIWVEKNFADRERRNELSAFDVLTADEIEQNEYYYTNVRTSMVIDIHGGITFSDEFRLNNANTEKWTFGFDCAHAGDIAPYYMEDRNERMDDFAFLEGSQYRYFDYVENSTEYLLEQLKFIGDNPILVVTGKEEILKEPIPPALFNRDD